MTPALSLRLQTRVVSVPVSRAALLISLCALTLAHTSYAQTYTQGLPAVGNNSTPSTAAPSKMIIDATMFPDTDMCASIADACAKLGATNYPAGATIDARGFTGTTSVLGVHRDNDAEQLRHGHQP